MRNKKNITSFKTLYAFGNKLPVDLSLSENPLGCSPKVSVALKAVKTKDCFDYPDPNSDKLREAISNMFHLDKDSVFVANGSEAIIKLLPEALLTVNDEVIIPKVTFPMFEIATELSGNTVIFSDMTSDFDIDLFDIASRVSTKTKMIILCNPNNPTGKIIKRKDILRLTRCVKAFVVVDEANIEFGGKTVIKDTKTNKNLIVLRTFSKGFGLAGFRVGFCIANPEVIQLLKRVSQPFPVSVLSQKAAVTALSDLQFISKTKSFVKTERDFLTKELRKRGFCVINSSANNLLVGVNNLFETSTSFNLLLNEKGVSIVDGQSFHGLEGKFVRVSPRLRKVNKQFLRAIDQLLAEKRNDNVLHQT